MQNTTKMNFDNFCYLVANIIIEHMPLGAVVIEKPNDKKEIVVDGQTELCKLKFIINNTMLEYWYNYLYQCISSAEDMGDTVNYSPFWNFALKPYIVTTLQSLLGKELITL